MNGNVPDTSMTEVFLSRPPHVSGGGAGSDGALPRPGDATEALPVRLAGRCGSAGLHAGVRGHPGP